MAVEILYIRQSFYRLLDRTQPPKLAKIRFPPDRCTFDTLLIPSR